MTIIDTGPLSRANVHQQYCSDWLKAEMLRIMDERDVLKQALQLIQSHHGKTLLADCCVTNSCHEHFVDGDKVSNCAYQYGVFDGYATLASIAEETLKESQ